MSNRRIMFSLIMATYGRIEEIAIFLESILQQSFDLSLVEVIIVDQNENGELADIIEKYSALLNVIHINSNVKGLSFNRNIGLKIAKGDIIGFPDDDCTYYPDTLSTLSKLFTRNGKVDALLGQILDEKTGKKIIRNWKNDSFVINKFNFFLNYSSITIFVRKNNILFDEDLGVGKFFGSYEDADYVLQLLVNNLHIEYIPDVKVWHPEPKEQVVNFKKVYSYGLGFGALVYKHLSFSVILLFMQSIIYHSFNLAKAIFFLDGTFFKKSWLSIKSRFVGLYLYATR